MNIAIIGTGNVAWHLAKAFEKEEFIVTEIYGRDFNKAQNLANDLYNSKVNTSLDFSESEAEVFFLCVSDDAIEEVCSKILLPENAILVHTSGAKPLHSISDILAIYHDLKVYAGVFYPLMTFTKDKYIDFRNVPICIEAENPETAKTLKGIAQNLSDFVYFMNTSERMVLHVSAVFACNFTNHLWGLSKEILEAEELDFDILKPLITETFKKAMAASHPADVQTGPAIRQDFATQNAHLRYLADDEDLTKVYQTLSESIRDWHSE